GAGGRAAGRHGGGRRHRPSPCRAYEERPTVVGRSSRVRARAAQAVAPARREPSSFSIVTSAAETSVPARIATAKPHTGEIAKATKRPPCGARGPAPKASTSAPAAAPPAAEDGIPRRRTAAGGG